MDVILPRTSPYSNSSSLEAFTSYTLSGKGEQNPVRCLAIVSGNLSYEKHLSKMIYSPVLLPTTPDYSTSSSSRLHASRIVTKTATHRDSKAHSRMSNMASKESRPVLAIHCRRPNLSAHPVQLYSRCCRRIMLRTTLNRPAMLDSENGRPCTSMGMSRRNRKPNSPYVALAQEVFACQF